MAECLKCGGVIGSIDTPCSACGDSYKKLQHEQINAAYKAGIRKCIAIYLDASEGDEVVSKMEELLKPLYC